MMMLPCPDLDALAQVSPPLHLLLRQKSTHSLTGAVSIPIPSHPLPLSPTLPPSLFSLVQVPNAKFILFLSSDALQTIPMLLCPLPSPDPLLRPFALSASPLNATMMCDQNPTCTLPLLNISLPHRSLQTVQSQSYVVAAAFQNS